MRKAKVFYQDRLAGTLEETPEGFRYTYNPSYLEDTRAKPVSLSLPLQEEPFESPDLFPFFTGLVPEGWYLDIVSKTLKVSAEDPFGILLATGAHTIGAVSIEAVHAS